MQSCRVPFEREHKESLGATASSSQFKPTIALHRIAQLHPTLIHLHFNMNPERGLQAAFGTVLAFSLLWMFATLLPDDGRGAGESSTVESNRPGRVANGSQYMLDRDFVNFKADNGNAMKIIHASSPHIIQRVGSQYPSHRSKRGVIAAVLTIASSDHFLMQKLNANVVSSSSHMRTQSSPKQTQPSSTSTLTHSKRRLFPAWAWYSIVFVLFKTRFYTKKSNRTAYEDDAFLAKSGLNAHLEYGLEYEDDEDMLSVDHSHYGSTSWNELNKFDV